MPQVAGDYEEITLVATAVGLTAAKVTPASSSDYYRRRDVVADVTLVSGSANYRMDGTDPTALVGIPLPSWIQFRGTRNLSLLKFFPTGAGTVIRVQYLYDM